MNLVKRMTRIITSFIIISLILLPNNIYSIQKNEKSPQKVIIGGELLQIEMKTKKVMVYGVEPESKLKDYDLIESISGHVIKNIFNKNEISINRRSEIVNILLNMNNEDTINLRLLRNNRYINLELNKKELNHSYLIEEIPYSATLTYIDESNNSFGAVAHNLETKETKDKLSASGDIYLTKLDYLQMSHEKYVGSISGKKIYDKQGKVNFYSDYGVNGKVCSDEILKNKQKYEIAQPEEVQKGTAYLVLNHNYNEDKKFYKVEITKVNKQYNKSMSSFEFIVKDEDLIEEYGGIVQGMSGCPIIQNNKLIGALSHVKTTNTLNGTGLYIKWMMED